jgi:putative Mg2+ transporter-C (MgtC) family protein
MVHFPECCIDSAADCGLLLPVSRYRMRAFQQASLCRTENFYSGLTRFLYRHDDGYLSCGKCRSFISALSTAAGIGVAIISTYSILYSSKSQIKGLTTAAGLWACSFLGLATGCGLYTAAAAGFAAVLCTLSLLPSLEIYLKNRSNHFEIHLELKDKHNLHDFITTIRKLGLIIDDIELNPAYLNSGLSVFSISLTIIAPELKKYKTHREIIDALKTLEYISYIEEIR